MERPRILVLIPSYLPLVGGAERATAETIDRLSEFEFHVVCAHLERELPRTERIGNATVHRVGLARNFDAWLLPLFGMSKAIELHRERPFSLVHAVAASQGAVTAVRFTRSQRGVPLLLSLQEGDEIIDTARRWLGPLYRAIYRRADRVVGVTEHLTSRARALGARDTTVVPNGVDVSAAPRAGDRDRWRQRLVIPPEAPVLVSVSRLEPVKRVESIVRALPLLPQAHLVVVGAGRSEAVIRSTAQSERVADRVHLVGALAHEDVPGVLAAADVFVSASRSEGLPVAILEAMASRTPVIAAPIPGVVELVHDGETGLWFDPADPKTTADAVTRLESDGELRDSVVGIAHALVSEGFGWDSVAERMRHVYSELQRSRFQ